MNISFYANDKTREQELALAFLTGVEKHGDTGWVQPAGFVGIQPDLAVMVGVKSLYLYRSCQALGIHTIMLDKGYQRHRKPGGKGWEYWRVAVDWHSPSEAVLKEKRPADRVNGLTMKPWRVSGKHIVIAGSSAKYHRFHNLPNPTEWATDIVKQLRRYTKRKIIYRPKPSWHDAVPIPGTTYSGVGEDIADVLKDAHALVTHGSNACFESIMEGVPCVILGGGVAGPISSKNIEFIENPVMVSERRRMDWLAALTYCQWTVEEFASGMAWEHIRKQIGD